MKTLVQIEKRTGRLVRVPRSVVPILELPLDDNQEVQGVRFWQHVPKVDMNPARKTHDWDWECYIVTRLRPSA